MKKKDAINVEVDEEKEVENESALSDDTNEAIETVKKGWNKLAGFVKKTAKKVSNTASNAASKLEEQRKIDNAYNEVVTTFTVVGAKNLLGSPIEIDAFVDEKKKTLFFRQTENIENVIKGTILRSDEAEVEIKDISKDKQEYFYVDVDGISFEIAGFKASYK